MVDAALSEQPTGTYEPEAYTRAARAAVDDGFEIVKFDLDVPSGREIDTLSRHLDGPELEHKRSLVEAVTDEIGDGAEVAVDLHWNFGLEAAEALCDVLSPYDLAWIEDPFPPENTAAMAELNRRVDQPILTGENATAVTASATSSRSRRPRSSPPIFRRPAGSPRRRRSRSWRRRST